MGELYYSKECSCVYFYNVKQSNQIIIELLNTFVKFQ